MDSILTSIKKLLGVTEDDTNFDQDITIYINGVFMILTQLGVGPENGYSITDKSQTWVQFIGSDISIEAVKSYTYLKVRLIFDPPQNSFLVEAINNQIKEYEWRINAQAESTVTEGDI